MPHVVNPAEFESWWKTLYFLVSMAFCCTVNTYLPPAFFDLMESPALYVVLFIFSVYTLTHSGRPAGSRFLLVTTSAMFLLGTLDTLISVVQTGIVIRLNKELIQGSPDFPGLSRLFFRVDLVGGIGLAVNNFVTDLVFLYRCYVIWGSKKTVLILPGISIFATVVVGCISVVGLDVNSESYIDTRIPFIMGAGTNVIFVCLTAGRIWYIRHEAHIVNGNTFRKRYDTAIAMILESGGIYCVLVILEVIARSFGGEKSPSDFVLIIRGVIGGMASQGVNIVPTLILVRVGMGHFQWKQSPRPFDAPLPSERTSKRRVPAISVEDTSCAVIEIK
ncbi:hypothetical protein DFH09DRAFT_1358699 [Mycena vulgaris]|nr:hypothetical protein DFH09DRAFT_1358699 [Mycena vulgaris]